MLSLRGRPRGALLPGVHADVVFVLRLRVRGRLWEHLLPVLWSVGGLRVRGPLRVLQRAVVCVEVINFAVTCGCSDELLFAWK